MALDKLVDSSQLDGALGSTAEAIRDKTGSNSTIAWDMDTGFYDAIEEIVTLEEGTADGTATSSDILYGKIAYVDGAEVIGNIPSKTSVDLTVSGATVTVPAGNYASSASATVSLANPSFEGGDISATASVTESYCSVSSSTNNSGASVTIGCSVTRAAVTYDGAVEGYVSKSNGDSALTGDSENVNAGTYYINGVTIVAPSSGNRTFAITVPNGSSANITFTFTVDASGNTTVTES